MASRRILNKQKPKAAPQYKVEIIGSDERETGVGADVNSVNSSEEYQSRNEPARSKLWVSWLLTRTSLRCEGTKGRVKYPAFVLIL